MSDRLKILYSLDRAPCPCFLTSELAELFNSSEKKIKALSKKESWQRFYMKEVERDGTVDSYPVWDVLTMPEETRQQIATAHYAAEEEDNPLLVEAEAEAERVRNYFSNVDFSVIRAAIYRARQFSMIQDAIVSLQLPIKQAVKSIAAAYGIDSDIFFELEAAFFPFNNEPFYLLKEEIRLLLLVHHYSACSYELLPELLPEEN